MGSDRNHAGLSMDIFVMLTIKQIWGIDGDDAFIPRVTNIWKNQRTGIDLFSLIFQCQCAMHFASGMLFPE